MAFVSVVAPLVSLDLKALYRCVIISIIIIIIVIIMLDFLGVDFRPVEEISSNSVCLHCLTSLQCCVCAGNETETNNVCTDYQ